MSNIKKDIVIDSAYVVLEESYTECTNVSLSVAVVQLAEREREYSLSVDYSIDVIDSKVAFTDYNDIAIANIVNSFESKVSLQGQNIISGLVIGKDGYLTNVLQHNKTNKSYTINSAYDFDNSNSITCDAKVIAGIFNYLRKAYDIGGPEICYIVSDDDTNENEDNSFSPTCTIPILPNIYMIGLPASCIYEIDLRKQFYDNDLTIIDIQGKAPLGTKVIDGYKILIPAFEEDTFEFTIRLNSEQTVTFFINIESE